ncbi:MAG TPA: hypothetical protein VIE65_04490 [Methylobacter sp.]|jgi:hypothetical protein
MPDNDRVVAIMLSSPLTESFELTIARALDLKRIGTPLLVLYCNGTMKGCAANPFKLSNICAHCRIVRDAALEENLPEVEALALDAFVPAGDQRSILMDRLQSCKKAISDGAASTIKTFYRVESGAMQDKSGLCQYLFSAMARNFEVYSEYIYICISNFLLVRDVIRLEFFNGRIVPTRALMVAAVQQSIDFTVIEVSGYGQPIFLSRNHEVHDLGYLKRRLRNYLDGGDFDVVLGGKFFYNRRNGAATDTRSFLQWQKSGCCNYPKDREIIAIFLSSPDEFDVMGDQWFTLGSKEPAEFIIELRKLLSENYRIVVRMHPNQDGDRTGKTRLIIDRLGNIGQINLIRPRDPQSTYELIDNSRYILTFGSTVGLEATYWGKVSMLAGRAIWEDADVSFSVNTPADVVKLIESNPVPHSRKRAAMVGSYLMDKKDDSASLSWGDGGKYGFFANGKSYLPLKRKSFAYWISRALDRLMRIKMICGGSKLDFAHFKRRSRGFP